MKLGKFYNLEYLEYCLQLYGYIHNVLADASFGFLQVFLVELRSIQKDTWHNSYRRLVKEHQNDQELLLLLDTCTMSWLTEQE